MKNLLTRRNTLSQMGRLGFFTSSRQALFNLSPSSALATLVALLLFLPFTTQAQEHKSIKKVKTILQNQADAWNKGDIDTFMEDYWKSDKLQFIGSKGVTYGWEQTKTNYKRGYPDKATMGFLTFDILGTTRLSRKAIMMTGKFHLKREMGDAEGHFLLIWRKFKGKWVIVADHTS